MPLRLFAKFLVFLMLLASTILGQTISIQVETKEVGRAEASYLGIYCNSSVPVAGLRIPLRIGANNDITIDSVSFQYTVAIGNFSLWAQVTDFDREGFIDVIPNLTPPISTFPAGWGEICRIHFRTTMFAADAYVPVDTFCRVFETLDASDEFGRTISPSFTAGGIRIRQATPVENASAETPEQFSLRQNFPNPFNPSTQIMFSLKRPDHVCLDVYDVAGQWLATLADGKYSTGEHGVIWDSGSQSSGVYFYRLTTSSGVLTRKMLLIK